MTEFLVVLAIVWALLATAYAAYYQPMAAAHRALHQMLERGEIAPDQYAAHLNALERSR